MVTVPEFCPLAFGFAVVPVEPFLASWAMVEPLLSLVASFIWVSPRVKVDCDERVSVVEDAPPRVSFIEVPVLPADTLFSLLSAELMLALRVLLPEEPTDPR